MSVTRRASWAERIEEVLRPAPDGGFEAVVTEGAPYGVAISAHSPTHPDAAHGALLDALLRFGFRGDILLEDRSQRRVRRVVLKGDPRL